MKNKEGKNKERKKTKGKRGSGKKKKRKKMNLRLLEPSEGHLGLGDVLLGVLEVVKEGLVSPDDTSVLVSSSVRVTDNSSRLTAKNTIKVRSGLVCASLVHCVALSTASLEELGSIVNISFRHAHDD